MGGRGIEGFGPKKRTVVVVLLHSDFFRLFNYLSIDMLAKNVFPIIPSYMVCSVILFPCNRM